MKKNLLLIGLTLFFLIILSGCKEEVDKIYDNDVNIVVEQVAKSELPEGIGYAIKLKNDSKHVIKQNNVYLYFPIVKNNGNLKSYNPMKVEAKGNKLNIQQNEEVLLNVFVPIECITPELKDVEPELEIKGYIEEVKDERRFHIMGLSL
ncbi:hypothetical protein R9X47_28535 [Wukongibacter baidiensis]|uniref:hypothetical protein n=1 Tax=Wukongibacter baidiensis TaxID=1723361 RepID=UPI003D7FB0DD